MSTKAKIRLLLILCVLFISYSLTTSAASAALSNFDSCSLYGITLGDNNLGDTFIYEQLSTLNISLSGDGLVNGESYKLWFEAGVSSDAEIALNNTVQFSWTENFITASKGDMSVFLRHNSFRNNACFIGNYTVTDPIDSGLYSCEYLRVSQARDGQQCFAGEEGCLQIDTSIKVETKIHDENDAPYTGGVIFRLIKPSGQSNLNVGDRPDGIYSKDFSHSDLSRLGQYTVIVKANRFAGDNPEICRGTFTLRSPDSCQCLTTPTDIAVNRPPTTGSIEPYKICEQIDKNQLHLVKAYNNCIKCIGGAETGTEGIWTAIGCIKRDPTTIVQNLLKVGLGMGGGVALLMILAAGFLFSISQGDPKRTGEAKELITAAITGLLFIIFSVVILQFIGYTVLKIPGFGG